MLFKCIVKLPTTTDRLLPNFSIVSKYLGALEDDPGEAKDAKQIPVQLEGAL